MRFVAVRVAVVFAASAVSVARAQTSGTLRSQDYLPAWTWAPWVITGGPGSFPNDGGVATFATVTNALAGVVSGGLTMMLDAPISLTGMIFDSPWLMSVRGTDANNLSLTGAGATLDVQMSSLSQSSDASVVLRNVLQVPVTGGGTSGLTKTGPGTLTLIPPTPNSYTGGTHINGGMLTFSSGDATLGATGTGNGVSINGGRLYVNTGWTTARDMLIDSGGGTVIVGSTVVMNGVVSGPGVFDHQSSGGTPLILTAGNTLTGAWVMTNSPSGSLVLRGDGSLAKCSSYEFAGTVSLLNDAPTSLADRLSDTAPINMRGARLNLSGSAAGATTEAVGVMTAAGGCSVIALTPNSSHPLTLSLAGLSRAGNGTLLVTATALGAASAGNVAQVRVGGIAPALVGGGGAAGSTNISIIPWIMGSTLSNTSVGSSLVTLGATGLRPLATNEYAGSFGAATDNVRLTGLSPTVGSVTANALVYAPANGGTLSGGPITLTSGALAYSASVATAATIGASLNFGAAEGIISANYTLYVTGAIGGTGGVTMNGLGQTIVYLMGSSTYTGKTTLVSGDVRWNGTITADGSPSPLGAGTSATSPIVFSPGTSSMALRAVDRRSILNRDIRVVGSGPATALLASTYQMTVNGNIDLQRALTISASGSAAEAITINGSITGAGSLGDTGGFNILNGLNTFSGGVNMSSSSTWAAGSDSAFGTGRICVSGIRVAIQSSDASAHVLANPMVWYSDPIFQGTGALNFTGPVNLDGRHTVTVTATGAITLSGAVSNGGLTKAGPGTLVLAGPTGNLYTGGTILDAAVGTLQVDNTSGSGTGLGAVSIAAESRTAFSALCGRFSISGAAGISGRLSPGDGGLTAITAGLNALGTDNFGSSLVFGSEISSSMALEIGSPATNDKVNVAGLLQLSGTVYVSTVSGYTQTTPGTFDFLDWGTLAGSATLNTSGIAYDSTNLTLDTSKFAVDGSISFVAIPEPGMMGVPVVAAALLGRRRRSA